MTFIKHQQDLRTASAIDLEIKAEASGRIEGYASTFGGDPDRHGDVVTRGAFAKSLEAHKAEGTSPAMLWSHQLEAPIGKWLTMQEDSRGLFVAGQINLKTERGREAFEHVQAGDVGAFSIGFLTPEDGRRYVGKGAWALDRVELVEVSLVAVPANRHARLTSIKQLTSKAEAVDFLRTAGLSKAAAARFAAGGFPALSGEPDHHEQAIQFAAQIDSAIQKLKGTK